MSEILGALFKYLLALLAITAVVVVLYEALSSNKSATAVSDLTTLQADVNELYAGANAATLSGTSTDITSSLATSSSAPSSMVSGSTLINPWGGAVKVSVIGAVSPTPAQATIEFDDVPNAGCAKLASSLWPSMQTVSINGQTASSVTDAITYCGQTPAAASGDKTGTTASNTLIFTFNLT